jgi:AraC-like DNA-binding protein
MLDGFYRTEKLTLKQLSAKIDFPEYKTRALINETLGYRNFNDYINQLRIAESCEKLVSEPDTPILNIALDVGYRTLSSFNRAFKDILEQTPTAYRQKNISPQNND